MVKMTPALFAAQEVNKVLIYQSDNKVQMCLAIFSLPPHPSGRFHDQKPLMKSEKKKKRKTLDRNALTGQ